MNFKGLDLSSMSDETSVSTGLDLNSSVSSCSGNLAKHTNSIIKPQIFDTPKPVSTDTNNHQLKEYTNIGPPGLEIENISNQVVDETNQVQRKPLRLLHLLSKRRAPKIQIIPSSTDLSGTTAQEPQDKSEFGVEDFKQRITGRRRNGGDKMTTTPPRHSTGNTREPNSQTSTSIISRQSKKKGFLSFLCCGVPDSANPLDPNEDIVQANKVSKVPLVRPSTASRPEQGSIGLKNSESATPLSEKDTLQAEPQPTDTFEDKTEVSGAISEKTTEARRENENEDHATNNTSPIKSSKASELPNITISDPSSLLLIIQNPSDSEKSKSYTQNEPQSGAHYKEDLNQDSKLVLHQKRDTAQASHTQNLKIDTNQPHNDPVSRNFLGICNDVVATSNEQKQQYLLPPITPRFKGKKCLVLDLDETLVHSSFKILHQADFTIPVEIEGQNHNVYVIKRPGVDQFMKRVGELYEVVVFTASVSKYGDPLLDQLDIHHVIHHRLFRESCYNHQGNYVKDLSQVGRDLRETIIIDNSPTSYIFHPQHAVPISSWFSDSHDNELLDLIPVLEDLAGADVRDVSLVLDVAI